MKNRSRLLLYCIGGISLCILTFVASTMIVHERLEDTVSLIQLDIVTQGAIVTSLSEIMSRGGVDDVTAAVIKDCVTDERQRFDELLGRLSSGLSQTELLEVSRLFDRCASYYARQKAVMASRFLREVEVYGRYIERYVSLVPNADTTVYAASLWSDIAAYEQNQSELFENLVTLQGEIINALTNGQTPASPALIELLTKVREVQEMQTYNILKLGELREQLPLTL